MYQYMYIYILILIYINYMYIYTSIYIRGTATFGSAFGSPSRGAPNPGNCRRNRDPQASRSSRSSKLSTKSQVGGFAELQILKIVDEIEDRRFRGAPDPRKCKRNRGSEASRSSRSSHMLAKSRFGSFAEHQVGHPTRTRRRDGGLQPRGC